MRSPDWLAGLQHPISIEAPRQPYGGRSQFRWWLAEQPVCTVKLCGLVALHTDGHCCEHSTSCDRQARVAHRGRERANAERQLEVLDFGSQPPVAERRTQSE